ncbi:hypothetical protein V6Z12_A01G145500 [Gossypium hirsutum]
MAKVCFSKDILIMFMAVVLSVATIVSAQDSAMAPAPSMDTGSAFSMPVTGVTVDVATLGILGRDITYCPILIAT